MQKGMKSLFRKDSLFFIYQSFLLFAFPFLIYFLLFRPDMGKYIIQGDLTPYFIDPLTSFKEALSPNLNTGVTNIHNNINIGSAIIALLFLFLKTIFGTWSQHIYYYFAILVNYFVVYKTLHFRYKHLATMFITYVIFNNLFARYLLSPSLFHILLVPVLVYLLFFTKVFKRNNLYYLALTLTTLLVSTNLTYLFIIILVKLIHTLYYRVEKEFYGNLVLIMVFVVCALPIFFTKNFYHSPVQSRVNQEMLMYKIQGYSPISAFYLVDDSIFNGSDKGVPYINSFGNYVPMWILALTIVVCTLVLAFLTKDMFLVSIYVLFITIITSFKYISSTLMYGFFESPLFALLREYKKIGFIFVVLLTALLVSMVNKKKWIQVCLLLIMCVAYANFPFGPLNNKHYYVNIPYNFEMYSKLISKSSKVLFWPLDLGNGTNSQLEATNWGFYGYNPMHYFHSNYLDTARAQLLDVKTCTWLASHSQCDYSWAEPYFDFIVYRKDLIYQPCSSASLPYVVVYEDEYVKIFKIK